MSPVRYAREAAIFAACYIALDWASSIEPFGPFNITPWNPQPALAIVWLLLRGLVNAPAVFATIFAADAIVRDTPGGYAVSLLASLVLAAGYSGIAALFRSWVRIDLGLARARDLTLFSTVVAIGTGLVSVSFIGVLNSAGVLQDMEFMRALLLFWLGDAVGILVTGPLLLFAVDEDRRASLARLARRPETIVQILVLAAFLWIIFDVFQDNPERRFYPLFVPLIWIAARGGLSGAVIAAALVQCGVVLGVSDEHSNPGSMIELQALVATLTLTGLFLGVMVDERERAAASLRESLRLAAAGEMAGAIAHEVNQPLTAVINYGQAAQLLLAQGAAGLPRLAEAIGKMQAEGERAAQIVKRLRDFFRMGTTRLEAIPAEELAAAARRIGHGIVGDGTGLEVDAEPGLPPLYVDRLQLELLLRNLLANAAEAISTTGASNGLIRVQIARHDESHLRLVVADNGPGIPAAARQRLFEPFISTKSTGMGLGLAVSRAIAEAHGGTLESLGARRGEFRLVLPFGAGP